MVHHLRGETALTQAHAEAAMTPATDQGFPQQLAQATSLRGWVLAAGAQGEESITQLQQGLAAYQATGVARDRPYYLALLAEASIQAGQTVTGLEALAEAMATLAKSAGYWWEAELHRLKGALLLVHKDTSSTWVEAEECFCQALAVAHRQQAKSLELRAAMSLSRLWQRQGKRAEAWQGLADVYQWFSEGFETADLKAARALLKACAQ
jgi:predicted ATPase